MNQYPAWKYILLVFVIALGGIYATPNLYGEDPAVQISPKNDILTADSKAEVMSVLEANNIQLKHTPEFSQNKMLIRLSSIDEQQEVQEKLEKQLPSDAYTLSKNLAPATPKWLSQFGADPMYLGLDLRGGIHFLLQVDMETALKTIIESYASEIRLELRKEKIRNRGTRSANDSLSTRFKDDANRQEAKAVLTKKYPDLAFEERQEGDDLYLSARLTDTALVNEKRSALTQNIAALRNRVNALGVSEPVIQQQGLDRIVVQLPGIQDSEKAKEILGSTATLEYRMQFGDYAQAQSAFDSGRVPSGAKLFQHRDGYPVLLSDNIIVTGSNIQNASVSRDQNGQPAVSITLDGKGAAKMLKNTKANTGKPMAVVFKEIKYENKIVDGKEKSVPIMSEKVVSIATINGVFSKNFQTTGLNAPGEAGRLALLLRAGALKAPMQIIEERTVGSSMGDDSIRKGAISVTVGLLAVLIFMAIYYKAFGLIANVALVVNVVLIFAILSLLQATLTLPGIAGIVLTVGMAVDANVLIFERIKEELRAGSKIQTAIHKGYDSAFSTIADANITTFIASALLFSFGTGPIKGFAITLCIGIATSMFTAIMGTRALVNLIYGGKRLKSIAIGWGHSVKVQAEKASFKLMQKRYMALALSGVLFFGSIGALASKGLEFGVDFTGGYLIEVGYDDSVKLQPIRDTLAKGGFDDAIVQHFGSSTEVMVRVQPREGLAADKVSDQVLSLMRAQNSGVELRRVEFVGPQIGEELREDGGLALLFALIAIVIYVALRFQFKFSVGAVLALIHDVIITMGVFAITRIEFDLTVLAALLAVIGYSLNDTIVVFDRIRENFRKVRSGETIEILNMSITQTLSRTLITSATTMLVLLALYFLGGEVIHAFAFALIIGVVVGTYSSIFIAGTSLMLLKLSKDDLIEPIKEEANETDILA